MKNKIFTELLILIAIFIVGVLAFSFYSSKAEIEIPSFSVENEVEIAENLEKYLLQDLDKIEDEYVDSIVTVIETRLTDQLSNSAYTYDITVVKENSPNAFAVIGGKIFVHSGLIEICDSPEELAAVLAHEMGHVEKRHVVEKMLENFGVGVLTGLMTGGDAVIITEMLSILTSSKFSRVKEEEADRFALEVLTKSNISSGYLAKIFRKLNKKHKGGFQPEILASHPNMEKRIKKVFNHKLPEDFENIPFDMDWNTFKEKILQQVELSE